MYLWPVMSRDFPALIDIWSMVSARRGFAASWPMGKMLRLGEMLVKPDGDIDFEIHFGVDEISIPFAQVQLSAQPWLLCQRTLAPFQYQVERKQLLGLIRTEEQEASLPEGYEPYLVPKEPIRLTDLLEDELILSLPLVPICDDSPFEQSFGPDVKPEKIAKKESPFAALQALKKDD